eukprot:SAG31_NODE_22152_length_532_cov_1.251732_1_plen_146_part_00
MSVALFLFSFRLTNLSVTCMHDRGTWNQFTERDSAAMRRIFTLLRFFAKRQLLASPNWIPHVAGCKKPGVFASLFPRDNEFLYTLVNRGGSNTSGPQLHLSQQTLHGDSAATTKIVYDCWRGEQLQPSEDGVVSFDMEVEGFGKL